MKFPCPECERPLAPDLDWQYCPYCGSLLHHSSKVAEWKEAARFENFGAASLASDELLARGIPSRIRAEISSVDIAHSSIYHVEGGRHYHALDVSADAFDESKEILAEIRAREADGTESDVPPNSVAERMLRLLVLLAALAFFAVILIALLGAVVSWADKEFFGG